MNKKSPQACTKTNSVTFLSTQTVCVHFSIARLLTIVFINQIFNLTTFDLINFNANCISHISLIYLTCAYFFLNTCCPKFMYLKAPLYV